jgi:ribonuclease HI
MLIYNLWLARNNAQETHKLDDPSKIVSQTIAHIEKWRNLKSSEPGVAAPVERWLPPVQDWVKVNTDGAFRQGECNGRAGVVIRDHHGDFLGGACHFFPHVADAEGAELLACKRGLVVAREAGVQRIILETDSVEVAAKLKGEGQDRSIYGPLVREIKSLFGNFEETLVRSVRRTANEAAHRMAKNGCDNKLCKVWLGDAPGCIQNMIVSVV